METMILYKRRSLRFNLCGHSCILCDGHVMVLSIITDLLNKWVSSNLIQALEALYGSSLLDYLPSIAPCQPAAVTRTRGPILSIEK